MSVRARIGLGGAALIGPLVAFPTLLRPQLAIGFCLATAVVLLASRSVAYPLALWGLPGVVIALLGHNPFPNQSVELFLVGWLVLAIFLTLLREENALPLRVLIAGPVLLTLGLAVLMLARLGSSGAGLYGSYKLQLFLAENVTFVVAGILVARHRRDTNAWAGLLLVTVAAGSLVLLQNLVTGSAKDILPGRLALYDQAGPIQLARGAATGLLLAVFVLLVAPAAWRRIAALGAVPVLGIAFVGAGSRGPVVGLAAGLLVLLALTFRDRLSRRRLVLLGAALLASAVLVPQLVPGQNVSRSLSILAGGGRDAGGGDVSNGRILIWGEAWRSFGEHPLVGIGTGGFAAVEPVGIYPHNLFLEGASELGIGGLVLLAGLLSLAFVHTGRAWRQAEGEDRHHAALVAAYLGAAVVNAQFSGDFVNNSGIWLGAGLAFGLLQRVAPSSSDYDALRRLRTRWRRRGSGAPEPLGQSSGAPPPPARRSRSRPGRTAGGGTITAPAAGRTVRGEVPVVCLPGVTGWTVGVVSIECSRDGLEWREVGRAAPDEDYEVVVVARGGGRRSVAVLRSQQRAEELRETLASEHGVAPGEVDIRPARRRGFGGRETRETVWDTRLVEDGEYLLRSIVTDVTGREAAGAEIPVKVDNTPPSIRIDAPRRGAVLMGVVELSAAVRDEGSGVALVRFEHRAADASWNEVGTALAAPYRTSWNTSVLGEGDYEVRAIALDRAGNEAVGRPVPVRVERVVAAVKIEDPGRCLSRTVKLKASVRDEARTTGVEFQIAPADTFTWRALGVVPKPPYELELDTGRLEDGAYDLRAVARDRRGGIDASRILRGRVIDNVAPTLSMSEPTRGAVLRGEVPLSARAADLGSGITPVLFQFSRDGASWRPVVARSESAGGVHWDTARVGDGEYLLRAVVGDGAGNLTTSDPVPVRVDNTPPRLELEEPAPGAYRGGIVRLLASAGDEGSGVIAVRFERSQDGISWHELATAPAEPYAFSWDTTGVADGAHLIRAVARDRAGNAAFGEPVELTVRNTLDFPPAAPAQPPSPAEEPCAGEESEAAAAPGPEPLSAPVEAATLWQLERLLRERGASHPGREELEAILYTLRPYARPDGTIPERFWPLLHDSFGELLEGR